VAEPVLFARGFEYRYPVRRDLAVRDLSFELERGSFTVVAGVSGSGKSTLLRAAGGLVPHFHGGEGAGELRVGGLSVRDHGPAELAEVCGTVFQDPESQVVMGGVRAEIALALEHRGESPASVARAVEETALELGIGDLLERRTDTLSGGELQRVALAAALVTRPALLVLDEPTSQLDPVAGDELVWLLRRLNEESGTAVLLAEHRLERCLGAADRVLALDGGRLVHDARPEEFLGWASAEAPALATPLARMFSLAGLGPPPASVKAARAGLSAAGLVGTGGEAASIRPAGSRGSGDSALAGRTVTGVEAGGSVEAVGARRAARTGIWRLRRATRAAAALRLHDLWHELDGASAILRGIDLRLEPGERVALLGRNGAGKSTLLRHAKGLLAPTRGRVERAGEVALLLQSPGDYLVHERVDAEAGPLGITAAGLAEREAANPRDLSGGERQRLALETVLDGRGAGDDAEPGPAPAVVLLDEPTRGMDRAHKDALAARLGRLAEAGAAVLVATHDTEFAASFADRVVVMGPGVVIADGPAAEVLCGGRHFSTDVARVLRGAGGALTPEEGADVLRRELVPREVVA
jgi:energy-coupling factor transporter ATP-binding protein EcfA2